MLRLYVASATATAKKAQSQPLDRCIKIQERIMTDTANNPLSVVMAFSNALQKMDFETVGSTLEKLLGAAK
jgi:hypothetical protein